MFRSSVHLFSKRALLGIALAAAMPVAAFAQGGNSASSSAGAGNQHPMMGQSSHSMMGKSSMGAPKHTNSTSASAKPGGSPWVKSIQAALNRKEHAHLAVDGKLGVETRTALAKFQQAHGIKPSGRPTKATQKALGM